ncbi:MAG: hypothetical protein V4659_06775 [Pseudomonadota bacterium]
MIGAFLLAVAAQITVRPEPVEARVQGARASTSSARRDEDITPLDAERDFAADAQRLGQWSAFRKWAAPAAIFLPPENVHAALKDAPDPAKSVEWWPTAGFLSCDGTLGANTGGAVWPDGRTNFFSTLWAKQAAGGWRWTLDHGGDLAAPRPRPAADPAIRRASCDNKPRGLIQVKRKGTQQGSGTSKDKTLGWSWTVEPDGTRVFYVHLWTGTTYEPVIADRVAAPKPK